MLQRLTQFGVSLLKFLEQANVLDGDDRLRGEGLQQRYLLVCKGLYLSAADVDHPDCHPFPQQRRRKKSSNTTRLANLPAVRKSICFRQHVRNVDRPPLEHGLITGRMPRQWSPRRSRRNHSVVCRQDHLITL